MGKKRKTKKIKWMNVILAVLTLILIVVAIYTFYPKNNKVVEEPEVESNSNEVPTPEPEPQPKKMSLVMTGDALIHGAVYLDARKSDGTYDFSKMFTSITPIIENYDLRYYNQESIIGGGAPQHYPRLNTPDALGRDLVGVGFNMVSLANNHTLDKNESGILYSNEFWSKQEGVIKTGTFSSWEERDTIPIYEQNDIKYSFLSYTMMTNGLKTPTGKEYLVNVYSEELVKKDIQKAKENGAEVIIVAMHWGEEYTHVPTQSQKSVAEYLSSLGVNLIIGSHPHVIQPIAYVNDTLVIYSLGNFISAQKVLGLEKIIGLLVGLEIVVEPDSTVHFENINKELLYTYYNNYNKDFKVIPFSELTDSILKDYEKINQQYRAILDREV